MYLKNVSGIHYEWYTVDDYRILIIRWTISLNDLTVMIISKSALLCEFRIFVKNVHVSLNACIMMMN